MSDDIKSITANETEPTASSATLPLWLVSLTLVLLFGGAVYFDARGGWFEPKVYGPFTSLADLDRFQPRMGGEVAMILKGKKLFEANCALCHNTDGMGKPNQAPPLSGSEWVLAAGVNRLARIPQVGLGGPLEVKGQQWSLLMAGMGAQYSHDDLAAVLSYIRNSWGNKASIVTPEEVGAVRKDLGNRSQPYTADELKSLPEKTK